MAADTFDIQQLVLNSGVTRRTIYFYVQQGLLPPPQGAGLAAYYTNDHLMRLKIIPILRGQGLRLDSIRERLEKMSPEDMQALIDVENLPLAAKAPPEGMDTGVAAIPMPSPPAPASKPWNGERYVHYSLPAGISITVPENMSPADHRRLQLLLQAAQRIFTVNGPQYVYQTRDKE